MGIYIKGMEMPTSCRACLYSRTDIRNVDWCVLTEKDLPCDCPLILIPPHGRLIDADALMGVIRAHDYPLRAHFNSTDNGMFTIGIQQAVDEAPTIIPAEEGE